MLAAAAQTQQPIRVNCGGASTNTATTTGTSDPTLYRSNRYSQNATPLIYNFPIANGAYRVNLLFAENSQPQQAVGAPTVRPLA